MGTEDLNNHEARHRPRYDEITTAMGIFDPAASSKLRRRPLEQLWRDHLLACSMLLDPGSDFDEGRLVVLHPEGNTVVADAVNDYRACLLGDQTFVGWTLEHVLGVLDQAGAGDWAGTGWAR